MIFAINRDNLLKFGYELYKKLIDVERPIFLCVGSDKFVSDSLAPIVAEKLKKEYKIPAIVYGGLDYNINATNLVQAVKYIETMYDNPTIVVIDATLDSNVGEVVLTSGVFAGFGKCVPNIKIGNISILGVVGRKVANFDLNSTRLSMIVNMADFIAKGCFLAVNKISRQKV